MAELHPHQRFAVANALKAPLHRWIDSSECGAGKTAPAIVVAKEINAQRVLVICPSVVRQKWATKEFPLWWPDHPPIGVIEVGWSRVKPDDIGFNPYLCPIQIVSYGLVGEVAVGPWDLIIIDESHRVKNSRAARSKVIRQIVESNPVAAVLALTATPMADKPQDVHNILDILWPKRFGSRFKFQDRYQLNEPSEYATSGKVFHGINPIHAAELRDRLAAVSSRTTKAEIAHLLPPFDVDMLRVKPKKQQTQTITNEASVWAALYDNAIEKIPHVTEWVEDALESSSHVTVLVHHRDLARRVALAVQEGTECPVYVATGESTASERNEILRNAEQAPRAIVVATIDAVGIGIDMTFSTQALFAELSYNLESVLQALGRFSRLSGSVPSSCRFLVLENTIDEVIANRLMEKTDDINAAIKPGDSSDKLSAAMKVESGDSWLTELATATKSMVQSSGYFVEDDL